MAIVYYQRCCQKIVSLKKPKPTQYTKPMYNPILMGLTCGSSFLLSFLLFNHPRNTNKKANKWLGLFMITFGLAMLQILVDNLNLTTQNLTLVECIELSRFLSAPALYLSVLFFTTPARMFHSRDLWHFAPFFLFLLYRLPYILPGAATHNPVIDNATVRFIVLSVIRSALPMQSILYLAFAFFALQKHQRTITKVASSTTTIDLAWLKYFLLGLFAVVVLWLNLVLFTIESLYAFTPLLYLTITYFLAYFSLHQTEIYAYDQSDLLQVIDIIKEPETLPIEKQKRLSDSQLVFLKAKLEHLMQQEKVYLDNELNLLQLAQKMEITSHELSYLINEGFEANFFQFVNTYRVEEAKKLLASEKSQQLNMLGIAYQAGFNSKTTFNTTFKKLTGQSPSDYLQALGESKS